MAVNATLRAWLDGLCQSLASKLRTNPAEPYDEASVFVAKFVEGAVWAYKAGGDAELASFGDCPLAYAKQHLGLVLSAEDETSLYFRLSELSQRAKTKAAPTWIPRKSTTTSKSPATRSGVTSTSFKRPTVPVINLPEVTPPSEPTPMPLGPMPEEMTPEQACVVSGGAWDPATTSCVSASVDQGPSMEERVGPLDFPRVHRSALGYGYWALDIPPEAESVALATLDVFGAVPASGPVAGVPFVALTPSIGADAPSARAWVEMQRSAGLGVIATIVAQQALMAATADVSVASALTNENDAAAVMFEPSGGWTLPDETSKTVLYVALGAAGVAVIAGGAYFLTRKPKPRIPNRRRRRRR